MPFALSISEAQKLSRNHSQPYRARKRAAGAGENTADYRPDRHSIRALREPYSRAFRAPGLPTTAAYIVCATAIAPALINLGVPVFPAHLFLLFFASISAITPPVAVASYAAAGIAQENPVKVSWTAFKLGITGFILPFAFVLNGDYLHIAFDLTTLLTLVSALVVSISLALAIQGYGESKLSLPMRLLFLVSATVAITPYRLPSLIAAGCFAIAYGREKFLKHEEAKPAAPEKAALKPA